MSHGEIIQRKIELGGGYCARKAEGFYNVDIGEHADYPWNLEDTPIPLPDDSVDELYASHCLEHVRNIYPLLRDCIRFCRISARIEFRQPHWLHQNAMYPDHKHVLGDRWWQDLCAYPERWLIGPKKPRLVRIHYQHDIDRDKWAGWFPQIPSAEIVKLFPSACHEIHVHMEVVPW